MVAKAVPNISGQIPTCFAHDVLSKAKKSLLEGNETYAAVCLREACKRYLQALADYHGLKVPKRRKDPQGLFVTLTREGVEVDSWIEDVIDSCEALLDFDFPDFEISDGIDLMFSILKDFTFSGRNGGAA